MIVNHNLNISGMCSGGKVERDLPDEKSHQLRIRHIRFRLLKIPKMQTYWSLFFFIIFVSMLTVLSGCATVIRTPLPADQSSGARIPGMTDIRYWGDTLSPEIDEFLALQISQAKSYFPQAFRRTSYDLAISGGGANGAFGAGLLVGWSEAGDRPTGVYQGGGEWTTIR